MKIVITLIIYLCLVISYLGCKTGVIFELQAEKKDGISVGGKIYLPVPHKDIGDGDNRCSK